MMAREEARATIQGVVFINQHLRDFFEGRRTIDSIKGIRKSPHYRDLVTAAIQDLRAVPEAVSPPGSPEAGMRRESDSDASFHSASENPGPSEAPASTSPTPSQHSSPRADASGAARWSDMYGTISLAIGRLVPLVEEIEGYHSRELVSIARAMIAGRDVSQACCGWLRTVFPLPPPKRRLERPRENKRTPKRQQRRMQYARTQRMFKTNMSRAAHEILDGPNESTAPCLADMLEYWEPVLTQESIPVMRPPSPHRRADLQFIWQAVSCEEAVAVSIDVNSAPGIDGITARQWKAVPASIKALYYNIILSQGGFPEQLLVGRTVFIPKKTASVTPAEFRPISIASIVVRHLHKILAERAREAGLVDVRQRCLDDGCAENVSILAALLDDARTNLREMHVASLDYAKAFDSVSHEAITAVLEKRGLPTGFVRYIARTYENSKTCLEVEGSRSEHITVKRGVRQGDPLSSWLFCLVVDEVLGALPSEIGYEIEGTRLNAIAYADDVILISTTSLGMQSLLRVAEEVGGKQGLALNASKCVALSIVPAGKQKKYKVLTTPQFHLASGEELKQLTPSQEWRYLGVDFRPIGPRKAGGSLHVELDRISKAPLKPQQRLKILRCFLIPRLYYRLVLAGTTLGKLKALDKQVRAAIRKWLRFPADVALAYYHTTTQDGGLGIPSLTTTVPRLMRDRLKSLAKSSSASARAVARANWVTRRERWAEKALTRQGEMLDTTQKGCRWWAQSLHRSVDGKELRECAKTDTSSHWVDAGSYGIPGRDYVQYHHIRVNCLPTRIRTTRGFRRADSDVTCRAGCNSTETAAHVIQACFRTHGGRVKRHNAVCKVVAAGLRDRGWTVDEEPRIPTLIGMRKPDIVATKEDRVVVIDAQVVGGQQPLNGAHQRKIEKYGENRDVRRAVRSWRGREHQTITFGSCTLSWRGVWSSESVSCLLECGLSKGLLRSITTRVIQGSHTNWTRWNQMTEVQQLRHPPEGIG